MLVLTRHVDQDVYVGRGIRIRILSISGRQVQLGIDAPREVTIHRGELLEVVRQQNAAAAEAPQPEDVLRDAARAIRSASSQTVYSAPDADASSATSDGPIQEA